MKKLLIGVAGLAMLLALHRKKGAQMILEPVEKKIPFNDNDLKKAFATIKVEFGEAIAKRTEQLMRLETAHFSSDVYKHTLGAGMLKFGSTMPFGWGSMLALWTTNPKLAPIGYFQRNILVNAAGAGKYVPKGTKGAKVYTYLVFPSVLAGAMAVATFIKKKGSAQAWVSNDKNEQSAYLAKLNTIKSRLV